MNEGLIKKINPEKINNAALKGLIDFITANQQKGIDVKQLSPSPQVFQSKFSASHTDHTDYSAHQDTGPRHSDYCD